MSQNTKTTIKKPRKLSRKQKGFIKDYIETGNGTEAALKNYDTDDRKVAQSIASENLSKPIIQDALPDDFLANKHLELFDQKRIDYFVFPKNMKDEEIIEHVASVGIKVISVRLTEKGKMAFYAIPDAQALKGALDMGFKIKGKYAAEKHINVNLEVSKEEREKILGIATGVIEQMTHEEVNISNN